MNKGKTNKIEGFYATNFFLVQSAAQKWSSLQKMIVLIH